MTTSWRDLVLTEIRRKWQPGQTFSRGEWLRHSMPAFEREFPNNGALEMSAQRALQNLRDEGRVEFLGGGSYRLPAVDSGSVSDPVADEDGVRRGLLARTAYEVLADAAEPLSGSAIMARVRERLQFTERELSTNASGHERWRTAANVAMSRSTFGGWLGRDDNGTTRSQRVAVRRSRSCRVTTFGSRSPAVITRRSERVGRRGSAGSRFSCGPASSPRVIDLDAEERDYKLKAAEKWAAAGAACADSSEDWAERLKQASGAGNLIDSFAQTWLRNRILDHPDEVRAGVRSAVHRRHRRGGRGVRGASSAAGASTSVPVIALSSPPACSSAVTRRRSRRTDPR